MIHCLDIGRHASLLTGAVPGCGVLETIPDRAVPDHHPEQVLLHRSVRQL